MFSTSEVLAVTKGAIAQMIDAGYMDVEYGTLAALDDHVIVDLGEKLNVVDGEIAVGSAPDLMFKALISQIGKIVIDNRRYTASLPNLFVDTHNWGLLTEQIMIELSDVMIDEMWNPNGYINYNEPISGGVYPGVEEGKRIASIEFGCYKPPVSASIYKKAHGIMVALTTARDQFFTAFRGVDEYNSFIAGLYNSVENTLQVKAEIYGLMTVSMGIAKATANSNVINLRDEWIALGGSGVEGAELLDLPDFQRYMLQRISDVKSYVRRIGTDFNNHQHVTFSSDPNVILLSQVANAAKFGVRANTYNEKLLGIGDYDTTPSWQASVDGVNTVPYNLTTASSILLSKAAATAAGLTVGEGETSYQIDGIIGVLYDRFAMGVTLDKRKVTQQYSASRDTFNHFYHSLIQYIVNDNYPIVAFSIAKTGE